MAKLPRVFQKLFGASMPSSDCGEFGSLQLGTPTTTKDPTLIQSLANWLGGWAAATIGTRRPAYQDMNAVHYLAFYQICYLLQMGIPEYDATTVYYINSYAQFNGILYQSLQDNNSGNEPDSSPTFWATAIDSTKLVPTGQTSTFAGRFAPAGYLISDGSAVSRSTYAALFNTIVPGLGTFTVTIATPGLFTLNSHGLVVGDQIYFTTTGALPTGLSPNTLYYVIAAGLTTNTFEVSATRGGSAINTTGSQSGVHTLRSCPYGLGDGSTTFNLPLLSGRIPVGYLAGDNNFGYLGQLSGEANHTLIVNEIPQHTHQYEMGQGTTTSGSPESDPNGRGYVSTATDGGTGGGGSHNNVQPSIAMNWMIKT